MIYFQIRLFILTFKTANKLRGNRKQKDILYKRPNIEGYKICFYSLVSILVKGIIRIHKYFNILVVLGF